MCGARDLRQPLALLLLGAEHPQRLGDADRLVRGEQRRDRGVPDAGHRQRAVVVDLRQAEAAVLLGDLHAHRADPLEALDDLVGQLRVALDLQRVDLVLEERPQLGEEALALLDRRVVEPRLGMDQIEAEVAEEEFLAEARQLPFLLARGLGDLPGLALAHIRRGHHLITAQLLPLTRRLNRPMRLTLAVLAALLILAAPAHAAGPELGIADDRILLAGGPLADEAVAEWADMGVEQVRIWRCGAGSRPTTPRAPTTGRRSTTPSTAWSRPGWSRCSTITGPGPLWVSRRSERGEPRYDPDPKLYARVRARGGRALRRPRRPLHPLERAEPRRLAAAAGELQSAGAARRSRRTCIARSSATRTRRCTPPTRTRRC